MRASDKSLRPVRGDFITFSEYLKRARRPSPRAVVWPWAGIAEALAAFPHGERGTLALANPDSVDPVSIVFGVSLAVQVVRAGERTQSHTHSFWHLYIVYSGTGNVWLSTDAIPNCIRPKDILLVPAWCPHAFDNGEGAESLVLLALQNLPQCAQLGNLLRSGAAGMPPNIDASGGIYPR